MSSVSNALAGWGVRIDGRGATPGTLNVWCKENSGYVGDSLLDEVAVQKIAPDRVVWPADGMHKTNDLSYATVVEYLMHGRVVIANVLKGRHFVLAVGWDDDNSTVHVHDSGFATESYEYDDIVGWRLFDMS